MRYTAVVLTSASRAALLARFRPDIPRGWDIDAHHMTINLGPAASGPAAGLLGRTVELKVISLASGVKAVAVGVECAVASQNDRAHITLAVNKAAGGRSRD